MILGGEQPVALPTMDWYDKDMMKLYLAAIKDDYDKAVKREDDFFEKYGDFIAATSKDLQFINDRVINPVVLFVNNNPDAIRSVEGRAAMASLMRTIPHEQIGNIKATAKMADTYNKVKAELLAKGLYSLAFEDFNGGSLENWDSAANGAFTKAAPTGVQSLTELTNDMYKNIEPTFKEKVGQFGRRMAITEKDLKDVITEDALQLILQTPIGLYYKHLYGDDNDRLINAIVQSQRGRLRDKIEVDKVAEAEYDAKMKAADMAIKQRNAALEERKLNLEIAKLQGGGDDTYSATKDALQRSGETLMPGGYDQFDRNIQQRIINQYNQFVKNDTKLKGLKKGSKAYNNRCAELLEKAYSNINQHRKNEWVKNVSGKSPDQLAVTVGTEYLLTKLRSFGSVDENGYYHIDTRNTKVLNNAGMTTLKNGHGYKSLHYDKTVLFKPAQDSKILTIIGQDGNPYMWIKMVNTKGDTRWINSEGAVDLNSGVAPEQDQRVLQKLGLKKQEGVVPNR